jgi:hypothetical protein
MDAIRGLPCKILVSVEERAKAIIRLCQAEAIVGTDYRPAKMLVLNRIDL